MTPISVKRRRRPSGRQLQQEYQHDYLLLALRLQKAQMQNSLILVRIRTVIETFRLLVSVIRGICLTVFAVCCLLVIIVQLKDVFLHSFG